VNYWDTSALLKLYVPEHDSGYFLDLVVSSGRPIVSSAIAAAEILCTLYRKECAGDLKSGGGDGEVEAGAVTLQCDRCSHSECPLGLFAAPVAQTLWPRR